MRGGSATKGGGPVAGGSAMGPLGRRLFLAFLLVAVVAIALVAGAGMIGSNIGLATDAGLTRAATAQRVAEVAAGARERAGGWEAADLRGARDLATAAGAALVIQDPSGTVVEGPEIGARGGPRGNGPGGPGMGPSGMGSPGPGVGSSGAGQGLGPVSGRVSVPIVGKDGTTTGSLTLGFGAPEAPGQRVAWSWIAAAALGALLIAAAAAWAVVRLLTAPLVALTAATRAFGAGERQARPSIRGVGELGELADAFDEAATAVAGSDAARRAMAADVAHELRTPLAALQAGLEELRDGLAPADPATLARLHDQSLRLGRTVDELAQLAAADAAEHDLRLQTVDLAAVVEEVLAARTPRLRAADLTLRSDLAPGVLAEADPDRLHQIVGNLLDNCIRYCRAGDQVFLTLRGPRDAAADDAGMAVLTVRDTGPGIPAHDLPHVTDRFWRGRQRHEVAGSGIGLAVVARLVAAHRGRLSIASEGSGGTTVCVELPCRR